MENMLITYVTPSHLTHRQLLKLENRIGDKRFKLDAKFADTDSEEEEDDDKDEEAAKLEDASRNAMDIGTNY